MTKISIVIPVYNTEKYLKECLESVINQTLKDIEIICVNDGSTDGSLAILEEYAARDERIKLISKPNGGYGHTMNTGIAAASGQYVGIVESDDWVESDMYEELYKRAVEFDAQVAFSSFYTYQTHETGVSNTPITFITENSDKSKCFTITEHQELIFAHPSIWAKIYKRDFLQGISFDETPGASFQDIPFNIEIFSKAKKMIAVHKYFYHYRVDNENASSHILQRNSKSIALISSWIKTLELIKKYKLYEKLKEALYARIVSSLRAHMGLVSKKYKREVFNKIIPLFNELKKDGTFTFKYFNEKDKKFVNDIFKKNFRSALFDEYSGFTFLNIPIFEKVMKHGRKKIKVFTVTIFSSSNDKENKKIKVLKGFLKIKQSKFYKKIYLLGIQIYKNEDLKEIIHHLENNINRRIDNIAYTAKVQLQHREVFLPYKNKYAGKEVVLMATGPSVKHFVPIEGAVYVGVNSACRFDNVKLDYLFCQDLHAEPGKNKAIDEYVGNNCKKFYGIIPRNRLEDLPHLKRVTQNSMINANARLYWLEGIFRSYIPYDISVEPLGDLGSTAFSAMQFALYTNPKRIYLVGCDCSEGHFCESSNSGKNTHLIECWEKMSEFARDVYPETEIISINPVGLKGMFKEIYTEKYIPENLVK